MGGLPLGTPRHHRHGGPLPRRPANATRANPAPPKLWREGDAPLPLHGVLVSVSRGCPPVRGMSLTRYAPFRRSPAPVIADRPAAPRLACVRPAASVHPEPGSNSSSYNLCYISSCVPWLHLQFRYLYLELTLSVFGTSLVLSLSSLFNELPMPPSGMSSRTSLPVLSGASQSPSSRTGLQRYTFFLSLQTFFQFFSFFLLFRTRLLPVFAARFNM